MWPFFVAINTKKEKHVVSLKQYRMRYSDLQYAPTNAAGRPSRCLVGSLYTLRATFCAVPFETH
jgi:hypothetical protein